MNIKEKFNEIRNRTALFTMESKAPVMVVRLAALVIMVALLTLHLRSLRVFRWEHSVTGGIIVTYFIGTLGLTLCAGIQHCGGVAFQAYLCATGAALMAVNAAAIWHRWKRSGDLTRVVAELLTVLGVRLRRQVRIKVFLSVAAAVSLLINLIFSIIFTSRPPAAVRQYQYQGTNTYNASFDFGKVNNVTC